MASPHPLRSRISTLLAISVHVTALVVIALVLVSVGQPIFTDDAWWHLAIGEVYASGGPWLSTDPFLFAATGPPAPAAWLSDVAFHLVHSIAGFQGLRVGHVLLVALTLALAWSMLRRVSGSSLFASHGTALFAVFSAYRFFQLRPHLFSILAGLLLVRLLVLDRAPPSRRRTILAALLLAIWANAHGAFVLGPVLLAAAISGVVAAGLLWPAQAQESWQRARGLLFALGLGLLATLLNPSGVGVHQLYFAAGAETPDLSIVADEWAPVALFHLPTANLPPTLLNWAIAWVLLVVTLFIGLRILTSLRRPSARAQPLALDPALIAVAVAALIGMLSAVRLLWLGLFPLLLIGAALRVAGSRDGVRRRSARWTAFAALLGVLLVPGFVRLGDWPMISKAIHPGWYALPYMATKRHAHAVWFLRDAELEGRLFNDYSSGNFLSYWVAPRLKPFINGSLNVPIDVLESSRAIMLRRGLDAERSFTELLDAQRVDLFFGTGEPLVPSPGRAVRSTTTHLEHTRGWLLVFRNMRSAIYLRNVDRNRENLRRVADYYAAASVPFDPERGFEPARVIDDAPQWAIRHGLAPINLRKTENAAKSQQPEIRHRSLDRLAAVYAVGGVYDRAIALDRRILEEAPQSVATARRLVWSLLHARRIDESVEAALHLERIAGPDDRLSGRLVTAARRCASSFDEQIAGIVSMLPLLDRPEGHRLFNAYFEPEARPGRNPQGSR